MSTTHLQDVVAEAICSAFYNMEFSTFLGEADDPGGSGNLVTWFLLAEPEAPRDERVRVAVYRENDGIVTVKAEWLNSSAGPDSVVRGGQTFAISTYAGSQADLEPPTQNAVVKVLEIYKDVLTKTGVAGPIEALAPEPDAEIEAEDMAVED